MTEDYKNKMITGYINDQIYDFLEKECRLIPEVWNQYGLGILSRVDDRDFWSSLSEHLDCIRVCDECGCPMIEGYLVDGRDTYCSDECLHKHLSVEEYKELYGNGDGDTYWTTWYEESTTFMKQSMKHKMV